MDEWIDQADWWLGEVADDPIYQSDVLPLVTDLIGRPDGVVLDLGCGEGQVMRALPITVIGCDASPRLLAAASAAGPVVRARLPQLDWLRAESIDTAYAVLVLEHLADLSIFAALARAVRTGGALVLVANHPAFTGATSGPIIDPSDGEFLWRWGEYFDPAPVEMPAGDASITFYHRPLDMLLNAAADAGWRLERMVERGLSSSAVIAHPGYTGQEQMPRLLGARWINTQGGRRFRR